MKNKKKLKEMGQRNFLNDDVPPLRAKVMFLISQKQEVASVNIVNETIIVYLKSSDKLVFNNLF